MEITSCQLLAYRKKQDANVVPPIVAEDHDLLRPTEKPVVMNPLEGTDSPNNYRYQIMIKANSDLSNASVSLNEIEDINLEFDNETSGTYCYKSPLQQYKDFLGQNLGAVRADVCGQAKSLPHSLEQLERHSLGVPAVLALGSQCYEIRTF